MRARPSLPTGATAFETPAPYPQHEEPATDLAVLAQLVDTHSQRLDRHRLQIRNMDGATRSNSVRIEELATFTAPMEDLRTLCYKLDSAVTALTTQLSSQSDDLSAAQLEIARLHDSVHQHATMIDACLSVKEDMELELAELRAQYRDQPFPMGGGGGFRPRPTLPDKFDGTQAKFSGFLLQCNRVFELFPGAYPTGHAQVGLITSLLTDSALTWVSPLLKAGDPMLSNLAQFTTAFTAAFADTDKLERDTRKLDSLRMTSSVQEYVRQFRELSAELGYNDVALRGRFIGGLPDSINDLLLSMPPPATFDVLVSQTLTIGSRLAARQEARLEARRQQYPRGNFNLFRPQGHPDPPPPGGPPGGPRGPLTDVERQRRRRENLCMFCASPAHTVRECPRVGHRQGPAAARPAAQAAPQARVRVLAIQEVEDAPDNNQGNDRPQAL